MEARWLSQNLQSVRRCLHLRFLGAHNSRRCSHMEYSMTWLSNNELKLQPHSSEHNFKNSEEASASRIISDIIAAFRKAIPEHELRTVMSSRMSSKADFFLARLSGGSTASVSSLSFSFSSNACSTGSSPSIVRDLLTVKFVEQASASGIMPISIITIFIIRIINTIVQRDELVLFPFISKVILKFLLVLFDWHGPC